MSMSHHYSAPSPLGALEQLPTEIRLRIYAYLLQPLTSSHQTWGSGTGLSTVVLCLSKHINAEALPFLYTRQTLVMDIRQQAKSRRYVLSRRLPSKGIPPTALCKIEKLSIVIRYATQNRGDCEEAIYDWIILIESVRALVLSMYHSEVIKEVSVDLENLSQRKKGPKLVRGPDTLGVMSEVLGAFSFLRSTFKVTVGGFDTIEYVDMFDTLRKQNADQELPLDEWGRNGEPRYVLFNGPQG